MPPTAAFGPTQTLGCRKSLSRIGYPTFANDIYDKERLFVCQMASAIQKSVNSGNGSNVWIAIHAAIFKSIAEMQTMITILKAHVDNRKYVCCHCALDKDDRRSNRVFRLPLIRMANTANMMAAGRNVSERRTWTE